MPRTTHKGVVYLTGYAVEAREGTVGHDDDNEVWRSDCELCEDFFIEPTKKQAVADLDDHFLKTHTTFLTPVASPD